PARLAARIPVRPAGRLGATPRRRATGREPANAAAWPFFIDPLPAPARSRELRELSFPSSRYWSVHVVKRGREHAMIRGIRICEIVTAAVLFSTAALAQAPPTTKPPVAPNAEQHDPNPGAQAEEHSTSGTGPVAAHP